MQELGSPVIKHEELFACESNPSLNYFYASNKILPNPSVIADFFTDFPDFSVLEQEEMLAEIISILETMSTNSYSLNNYKESNILEQVIELMPVYVQDYAIFNKLLKVLTCLLRVSSFDQKYVEKAINKITLEYYSDNKIEHKHLYAALTILKAYFNCAIAIEEEPERMIVFNGARGLEICPLHRKEIKWLFSNGLSIYFWIYLEDVKLTSESPLPKLFTIYSPNNGGLECYLIDNTVYYRILGAKYSEPHIGSNGLKLGQIEPKKWTFFSLEHESHRKFLGRSQIIFRLNNKEPNKVSLSPPEIKDKEKMKMIFFDRVYCKSSSIAVFPSYEKEKGHFDQLNKNKNSIDNFRNSHCYVFQERQGQLYERSGLGYSADQILHRSTSMNFQIVLPFLHLYKFGEKTEYPILNEILSLFVLFLRKSPDNQALAHSSSYPHMMAQLIKEIPFVEKIFNEETTQVLLHIKQTITNQDLLIQYHSEFLWPLLQSSISLVRKQEILEIIKSTFTQSVATYSTMIGLDQMINTMTKVSTKTARCCERHYSIMVKRFDKEDERLGVYGEEQIVLEYLLKIIELYIHNEKADPSVCIYKLCQILCLKFSPCFTLSLMKTIKKILTEKLNEKLNSNTSGKILSYLSSKKVYLIFVHVIENNYFAEIKAESIKIVYTLLLKKMPPAECEEISERLSRSLWKINELNDENQTILLSNLSLGNLRKKDSLKDTKVKKKSSEINIMTQGDCLLEHEGTESEGKVEKKTSIKSIKSLNSLGKVEEEGQMEQQNEKNKLPEATTQKEDQPQRTSQGIIGSMPRISRKRSSEVERIFRKEEEEIIETLDEEKDVGPQAPKLSNRLKGNKKFSFSFMSQEAREQQKQRNEKNLNRVDHKSCYTQIMEEEKTNQDEFKIENVPLMEKKSKKKKVGLSLNIDTDAINEMYTFGGEKGQQIVITEQQEQREVQNIRKLARKCLAAMNGQKFEETQNNSLLESQNIIVRQPPMTTSNKQLKQREKKSRHTFELNLIDEEEEEPSTMKKSLDVSQLLGSSKRNISGSLFSEKKPVKLSSLMSQYSEQNLLILYSSLFESLGSLEIPSILGILFSWIPQTNLELRFITDLLNILQKDDKEQKIKKISSMPELYDFLFELTYKGLLFEDMEDKKSYIELLENLIKKIFNYVFRKDPENLERFIFIIDWSLKKAQNAEYHPKCLFLTTRYIYFLLIDSVEAEIFELYENERNIKKIEEVYHGSFKQLGIAISKFCKFLPEDLDAYGIVLDSQERVIIRDEFENIPSIQPYFQYPWADYLLCEKYCLLFKKFFSRDWYAKSFLQFQKLGQDVEDIESFMENTILADTEQILKESEYYFEHSFIFTLNEIFRYLVVHRIEEEKTRNVKELTESIWQTSLLVIFAELTKDKNARNFQSETTRVFLKNCKFYADSELKTAVFIMPIIFTMRNSFEKSANQPRDNNLMTSFRMFDPKKTIGQSLRMTSLSMSIKPPQASFIENLTSEYINDALFTRDSMLSFENFKLNFLETWIPGESHYSVIKSKIFQKYLKNCHKIEENSSFFVENLSDIIENQSRRSSYVRVLVEASERQGKAKFRKLWKNLKIFGGPWTHPEIKFQNDTLFNKNLFSYERLEENQFFKYRISKHLSKYRLRFLLQPILTNPAKQNKASESVQQEFEGIGYEKNLHKALVTVSENRLLLGKRLLSWLTSSNNQNSNKYYEGVDIMVGFKKVRMVKSLTVRHGNIGIINDKLIFVASFVSEPETHLSISQYQLKSNKSLTKVWPLEYVKQIFKRRYINRKRGLEINFIHGKAIFLEFCEGDHEDFVKKIVKYKGTKCPNLIYYGNKSLEPKKIYQSSKLFKKWSTYQISNLEYLMELNCLGGRSYNDLTQYPVLPWVLVNFTNKLSLTDESSYRKLPYPMGACGSEQRKEGFQERYEHMGETEQEKFHYGTHYSSPAIVYHFLVRISPFTEGGILLQGGKFDFADRMFFSMMDSYKNATSEYSDVRQLLPELYTIPEVYLNINRLGLGTMQSQKRVHNVELPEWAKQNPYLFITKQRKAFQEFLVSKNLSKWIDLIFGYKQRGEEAVRSLNCFVNITYEDSIDFEQIENEKMLKSLETQILNFGQTPSQVFTKPHPERSHISSIQPFPTICDSKIEPRIYRPSRNQKEDLLKDEKQSNLMRQSGESIIFMKWFKDSKLVFLKRNGEMLSYKWSSSQTSKVPFQCAIERQRVLTKMTKQSLQNQQFFDPSLKVEAFPVELINSGHQAALGGFGEGRLLLIDTDTNTLIETYTVHTHTICFMRSDLKQNFLITGDISGRVVVWRINVNHRLSYFNEYNDHNAQITSIFISYDLKLLFTSAKDGLVFGYNIYTGKKIKVFKHPNKLAINNVIVSTSPLPVLIMFCNVEGIIYSYSINGQLIQRMHEKEVENFMSPILVRDSLGFEYVAYGNEIGEMTIRTLPYLDSPHKFIVAKDAIINQICFSKSGRFAVTGCSDGELSVIAVTEANSANSVVQNTPESTQTGSMK